MDNNHTLMRHPDNLDDVRQVPLNEWARYRRTGWEFCNELGPELAAKAAAQAEAKAEAEKKSAAPRRRTKPKEEE